MNINLEEFAEMDSSDQDEIIDHSFMNILELYRKRRNLKRTRRWRVRPTNRDWAISGYHRTTFLKIKEMDEKKLFYHTRMRKNIYEMLLKLTGQSLTKSKQQIHAEERLSLTLLYLAHGDTIQNLAFSHKIGKTTARNIILDTCDVLWEVLSPIYLKEPTESKYESITSDFCSMWDMPNCVGAIDSKHVAIKCPANSGSQFYNNKKFFSVVLIAACDAKYIFTAVSLGAYGSMCDRATFRVTKFGKYLDENTLSLPRSMPLPFTTQPFPHYFVGDCAFPLKDNLMRPFAREHSNRTQSVFNYRLLRARRVIENAFGILTARWRILKTTLEYSPENAEKIVLACLVLHNFIMINDDSQWYCPEDYVDSEATNNDIVKGECWNELDALGGPLISATSSSRRGPDSAYNAREYLANYFMNEGAVSSQDHILQ